MVSILSIRAHVCPVSNLSEGLRDNRGDRDPAVLGGGRLGGL